MEKSKLLLACSSVSINIGILIKIHVNYVQSGIIIGIIDLMSICMIVKMRL